MQQALDARPDREERASLWWQILSIAPRLEFAMRGNARFVCDLFNVAAHGLASCERLPTVEQLSMYRRKSRATIAVLPYVAQLRDPAAAEQTLPLFRDSIEAAVLAEESMDLAGTCDALLLESVRLAFQLDAETMKPDWFRDLVERALGTSKWFSQPSYANLQNAAWLVTAACIGIRRELQERRRLMADLRHQVRAVLQAHLSTFFWESLVSDDAIRRLLAEQVAALEATQHPDWNRIIALSKEVSSADLVERIHRGIGTATPPADVRATLEGILAARRDFEAKLAAELEAP